MLFKGLLISSKSGMNRSLNFYNLVGRAASPAFSKYYSSQNFPASILVQLKTDMKQAMRDRNKVKLGVIKAVISEIGYAEKAQLPFIVIDKDGDVVPIIHKNIKKRQDSIEKFEQGGRPELAEGEKQEIEILKAYLPLALSEEEIEAALKETIQKLNATSTKDLGKVMKEVELDPARAPKSVIAKIAKKLLS